MWRTTRRGKTFDMTEDFTRTIKRCISDFPHICDSLSLSPGRAVLPIKNKPRKYLVINNLDGRFVTIELKNGKKVVSTVRVEYSNLSLYLRDFLNKEKNDYKGS